MEELYSHWKSLCNGFTKHQLLIEECFKQISAAYAEKQRYYHTMEHIQSMIKEIDNNSDASLDKNVLLFATWFHDMVYDPKKSDNEEQSAKMAVHALNQLHVPKETIQQVEELILATANHTKAKSTKELNFFLDCDLKILGLDANSYSQYAANIRKEYKHVLSFIYNRERKKVLKRFMESNTIYRTAYFQNKYEQQARLNILNEIQSL